MLKTADSDYPIKYTGENRTPHWSKFKNVKDIDVMVYSKVEKRRAETGKGLGNWMYWCAFQIPCKMFAKFPSLKSRKNKYGEDIPNEGGAFRFRDKCYSIIGRTYATKTKCKRGDIVTIKIVRIRKFREKDKIRYTWMFPLFGGKRPEKKNADTLTTVQRIERVGSAPLSKAQLNIIRTAEKLSGEDLEQMIDTFSVIHLKKCPFWNTRSICPLRERFYIDEDKLILEDLVELSQMIAKEYLKFPIACPNAFRFRCRFVKSYYYDLKIDEENSEEEELEDWNPSVRKDED